MPTKRAVDAIWKTNIHGANEKLILYFLTSKHHLGHSTSSDWKELDDFIKDFEAKWVTEKELQTGTQLSPIKVQRTIKALADAGYVDISKRAKKFSKRKKFKEDELVPHESLYAVTEKIFHDYAENHDKKMPQSA